SSSLSFPTRRSSDLVNVSHPAAILLIVVIGVFAVAMIFFLQKRRSEKLQKHFGPEYDRTVKTIGDKRRAERELESREKRVESLQDRKSTRLNSSHVS